MSEFPVSDDVLAGILGDLDGPMIQPEADRIEYLGQPATRREVFDLLVHIYNSNTYNLLSQTAALDGDDARKLNNLKTALEQNQKLLVSLRELLNAGVDPEWDPHREE